jgi:hypothetical protein
MSTVLNLQKLDVELSAAGITSWSITSCDSQSCNVGKDPHL